MLTVKDINEVSFGKASFSGYKPEDVDNFIDEVVESYSQLQEERDAAVQKANQLSEQVNQVNAQMSDLKAKNAELQKKLAILAQKVESYREEEDGIKDAILSAQRMGREALKEAQGKAAVMMADAEENARKIMSSAKEDAARAAREYTQQVDAKRGELEEMKRQVSAFRVSLLEMYKKHLENINHIPSFRVKETAPVAEEPVPQPQPVVEEPAPVEEALPIEEALPVEEEPQLEEAQPLPKEEPEREPTLDDKIDLNQETLTGDPYLDDDLSQVGIDIRAYSDIPESLKREKESHFSNLEFGDNVDLGKKKRRK